MMSTAEIGAQHGGIYITKTDRKKERTKGEKRDGEDEANNYREEKRRAR